MDSGFNGPAQVGFENINGKCWASSFVQAIYACKPLLRRILTVECNNVLVIELKKALVLLKEKKKVLTNGYDYYQGAISVQEVNLLYNQVYDITNTPRESHLGEVTKFLIALNKIYNACGFINNSFFNYYDFYPFVLMQSKEIDINDFIKQQQASILSHLSNDNPEFIIFGCLFGRTRITRQISIGPYRFQICAIIFSIEGGGHFYTVTNYGRYDDRTVEVGPAMMEQYIKNGYDNHNGRQNTGHLFFFERIRDGAAAAAAAPAFPPPPPPPEQPECGICNGEINDDSVFYECPVHHIAHDRCAGRARDAEVAKVDRKILKLTDDMEFTRDVNARERLALQLQNAGEERLAFVNNIHCWECQGIMTKKKMTQLEKKKFQKINADYKRQEEMRQQAEMRQRRPIFDMGFDPALVREALAAKGGNEQAAIDYILEQMGMNPQQEQLQQRQEIFNMGFDETAVRQALAATRGDEAAAIEMLFTPPPPSIPGASATLRPQQQSLRLTPTIATLQPAAARELQLPRPAELTGAVARPVTSARPQQQQQQQAARATATATTTAVTKTICGYDVDASNLDARFESSMLSIVSNKIRIFYKKVPLSPMWKCSLQ